jgi:pilus assembly protein CpaC
MRLVRMLVFWLAVAAVTAQQPQPAPATASRDLSVTEGKSVLVDSPVTIERISVTNGSVAEAVVISPNEILVNGLAPGETSMIVWQVGANRLFFDLTVQRNDSRVDAIRREMAREPGMDNLTIDREGNDIFLRGTVPDMTTAQRAVRIAGTLGNVVNLLQVQVPGTEAQILLKVRFADVDRSVTDQLGFNLFSTGATNTTGSVTTGQFQPPNVGTSIGGSGGSGAISLTNALNVFLFRNDINLGATIAALRARNLLQILAEPNVLALNGHTASFLAGGEFPYPTLQGGGGGLGAVTIQFREFGVRINFTPTLTPRGTIRLRVTPEVSALDYANGLVFQGFTIPGLSTRRVATDIELEDGQSFAIGGLLDNRDTETYSRVPGLSNIPFFGNLFKSRNIARSNAELLVLVTPEIVRPIPKDQPLPDLNRPGEFLPPNTSSTPPRTPGVAQTGPVPLSNPPGAIPVEELSRIQQEERGAQQGTPVQYIPFPLVPLPGATDVPQPVQQPAAPAAQPAAPAKP